MLGRVTAWVCCAMALCVACGAAERDPPGGSGGAGNTGGKVEPSSGGVATGGKNTGGIGDGGSTAGGRVFGGSGGGGSPTGGVTAGGKNTGGANTGGNDTGGNNAGGNDTGGNNAGGKSTGGTSDGGKNTGGLSDGGSTGGAGGTSGAAGGVGTAGAGGQAGACGEYVACGCGCCGGGPAPSVRCFYPEAGDSLGAITAADELAHEDPNCAQAGCGVGVRHECCVRGAGDPASTAQYTATFLITALDRIQIYREGTDGRCSRFGIAAPSTTNRVYSVLELPSGDWAMELATDAPCAMSATPPSALGAIGSLKLRVVGTACVVDIHLTTFFERAGAIVGVNFDADGLALSGIGLNQCQ